MDLATIKYLVAKKGLSFTKIDRKYGLREGTIRLTVSKPHKKGEKIISEELGVPPQDIFPERYNHQGVRYEPQPSKNYNYNLRASVKC